MTAKDLMKDINVSDNYVKSFLGNVYFELYSHSQYFTTRVLVNGSKFRATGVRKQAGWMPPF